ncbi:STAS domain-containing protein [Paraglaciecola hydrolytica]|uniref:Anti-anti-sigma factor n=1 Tax=Paraglaciecola hydrolytica TaxID=1799789 RepID=A0A136A5X2_9ALTE|nr:STAS domain-containing protein [Paraglaciecola hydrolytica]KXI30616.1 anti-anti-sigma factor [Paraglaciecola hydrolytica]
MSLDREFSTDGKELTIFVEQKFDFSKVQDFRFAYTDSVDGIDSIVINLQKTEYMDSSALGMLLNMHRTLGEQVSSFKIEKCRPQVLKILLIACFDKKFQIS